MFHLTPPAFTLVRLSSLLGCWTNSRILCSDAHDSLKVVQELKGFMIDLGFINLMAQSKKEFRSFTNKTKVITFAWQCNGLNLYVLNIKHPLWVHVLNVYFSADGTILRYPVHLWPRLKCQKPQAKIIFTPPLKLLTSVILSQQHKMTNTSLWKL